MKRVAIYGGSFNPIHNGHLAVAKSVVAAELSDEVWLMVSPQNPLKPATNLLPEADRLRLARLATQGIQNVVVSDFEFSLKRPSYTWTTLSALHEAYPNVAFTLLVGSDNWAVFDRWAHNEEIIATYGLIIYPREGYPIDTNQLPPNVHLLNAPLFPVSSTQIREALKKNLDASPFLPKAVETDIKKHHLYQ